MTLTDIWRSNIYEISKWFKPNEKEPFNIVLVDIQKTAEENRVCCEEVELLGGLLVDYIALSYRWGELDEQFVPATDDYYAQITSFHLDDFYRLCRRMLNEPDLKEIKYVWVDAICIDQGDDHRKKAIIYRMTDIYLNATYIVAVPDLHKESLITVSNSDKRMYEQVQNNRWYIYHFIHENIEDLYRLDDDWRYMLNNPSDDTRQAYNMKIRRGRFLLDSEEKEIEAWDILSKEDPKDKDDHNQQEWITKYKTITEKLLEENRQERIRDAIHHLQDLFRDWANRAWVISEYSIAKEKNDGEMKYWFIHLDKEDDFYGKPFFTLDFHQPHESYSYDRFHWCFDYFKQYHNMMIESTVKRPFLEMILNSRATKNEDRFHAILPLSPKYHKIKTSKDTISRWHISNMKSVKLKLYEILDTEDKLQLLLSCARESHTLLPTFASTSNSCPDTFRLFASVVSFRLMMINFDLSDPSAIHFGFSHCGNYRGPCLHLRPIKYYVHEHFGSLLQDRDEVKRYSRVIKELGIETLDASFKFVTISSFCSNDEVDITGASYKDLVIPLFGSMDKNVWIVCPLDRQDKRRPRWSHYNKDYVFRVY
ncbi:uncharacterized protein BX664DRAFT_388822 [Halteromyces radiatus]|uniref:uncharacterized protein n=1 Tax=Halteromyces radiatus TaxID=101107 RepID=UPI002220F365|nr:uncharacterized protein BX664DRAFT_388822 [Halteromyces radiatus]KAI8079848.1 hypothetical protein BX664DRAFT_388822 [Halteromyces radiatus]